MKVVVFDIWGDYGHFRVPYTTSSPLTFPIPSKTVLYGIVSAILGYDKNNYLEKFQENKWKFAIAIRNKIVTTNIPENFINTKAVKMFARMPKGKSCRTQINLEFVKNPCYRIYATSLNETILEMLATYLKAHKTTYTVYLGISECIANFKYIGYFNCQEKKDDNFVEINSIIPFSSLKNSSSIDFLKENRKYMKIHLPTEMKPDRELTQSEDILIETNGNTIFAKPDRYYSISDLNENIIFF